MSDHPGGNDPVDPVDQDGKDEQEEETGDQAGGQVSEVSAMDPSEADTPISDSQSVAGQPTDESGEVDEGPTGPNARAGANRN